MEKDDRGSIAFDSEKQKQLALIFDPAKIVNSVGFQTFSAIVRLTILLIISIFGAFVTFGMKDITHLYTGEFWITTVIFLAEQTYSFSLGRDYTLLLLYKYNPDFTKERATFEVSLELINSDPEELGKAIDAWNIYDKETVYKSTIQKTLMDIEAEIRKEKSKTKPSKKRISRIEQRKQTVKSLLDPEYIKETIDFIKLKGWEPMNYRELVNYDQTASKSVSKNYLYSLKKYKRRQTQKKFALGLITSALFGWIAFTPGLTAAEGFGRVITTIALILVNLFWGYMDAHTAMTNVILPNYRNKNQAAMFCSKWIGKQRKTNT